MVRHNLEYNRILELKRHRGSRQEQAFYTFSEKYNTVHDLFHSVDKKIKNKKQVSEAQKYCLVAMVTAFEVYFKDRLEEMLNTLINVDNLLDREDYIELRELKKIDTKEVAIKDLINYAVVLKYNFQDLDDIDKLFRDIFNTTLSKLKDITFRSVRNTKLKRTEFIKIELPERKKDDYYLDKDFYTSIDNILNLRHNIVHDIDKELHLSMKEIHEYIENIWGFIVFIDIFIDKYVEGAKKGNKNETS